jgi:hypothetical protein
MCHVVPTLKALMLLLLGGTLLTLKILLFGLLWPVTSEGYRILGSPRFTPPITHFSSSKPLCSWGVPPLSGLQWGASFSINRKHCLYGLQR